MRRAGSVAAIIAMLAGCTTSLETRKDVAEAPGALRGIPYALPMRQYDITVTRRLASCNTPLVVKDKTGKDITNGAYVLPTLSFVVSAAHESKLIEGERYLVDYEQLSGGSKVTNFTIEYHDGTQLLKSVNASADDQTGEIIGKTVGTALTVAGLAFAPGAAGAVAAGAAASQATVFSNKNHSTFITEFLNRTKTERKPEEIVGLLLVEYGEALEAADCSDTVRPKVETRDALSAVITRLSTGNIRDEWQEVAGKRKLPGGFPDAPATPGAPAVPVTLTDVSDRLSAMLPFIGLQPLPPGMAEDVKALQDWQAYALAKLRAKKAARDAIDKALGIVATERWPGLPNPAAAKTVAVLDEGGKDALARLLTVTRRQVIDPKGLAEALAQLDPAEMTQIRAAFPDFVKQFLDDDNRFLPGFVEPKPIAGCFGPDASSSACVATLPEASASLLPADGQKGGTKADSLKDDPASRRNKALYTARVPTPNEPTNGLLVRPPVLGELYLCKAGTSAPCKSTDRLNKAEQELIPQLGQLRLLPLVNRAFANNGIEVSLAKDGRLTKFTYANKRAIAAAMAAAAADAAGQAAKFRDDQEKRQKSANDARIAELQYQIDLYDKQKKVAALGATPAEKSAAEQQAEIDKQETAILKAELTRLLVQQCLDRARANPASPQPCPA